jgi:hypothetical protein
MYKYWTRRLRVAALLVAAGPVYFLGGCGLTDQQLAQVWQSVITTGLNTIVSNALTGVVDQGTETDTGTQ